MPISRRGVLGAGLMLPALAGGAARAETRIRYLLTSPSPNVAEAPPVRPRPMTQDGLLGLFSGSSVGRDVVLEPATLFDMCGRNDVAKPSLEVVYDAA